MGASRASRPVYSGRRLLTATIVSVLAVAISGGVPARALLAAGTTAHPATLATVGAVPPSVAGRAAFLVQHHDPNAPVSLDLGLDVRNSAALDALIEAASTPGSPAYGHFLSPAQYISGYAPTDAQVAAVKRWATA